MSVPTGSGYYQTAPQVSLDWMSKGWGYFTQKMGVWIGAMLLCFVGLIILEAALFIPTGFYAAIQNGAAQNPRAPSFSPYGTLGASQTGLMYLIGFVLTGVMHIILGGLYRMGLRQIRGEEIGLADFLSIGDVALPLFGAGLLTSFLCMLGTYLCVLPGIVLYGLFMFTPLLIVDRKLGVIEALRESVEMLKSQWLMAAVFILVAYLVASLGFLACIVGGVATCSMFILSIAYGYNTFSQSMQLAPSYGAAQPGVWPPPPSASNAPSFGQPSQWPPQQGGSQPEPPASGQFEPPPPTGGQFEPPPPTGAPTEWPSQSTPPPFGQTPPDEMNRPPGGV